MAALGPQTSDQSSTSLKTLVTTSTARMATLLHYDRAKRGHSWTFPLEAK